MEKGSSSSTRSALEIPSSEWNRSSSEYDESRKKPLLWVEPTEHTLTTLNPLFPHSEFDPMAQYRSSLSGTSGTCNTFVTFNLKKERIWLDVWVVTFMRRAPSTGLTSRTRSRRPSGGSRLLKGSHRDKEWQDLEVPVDRLREQRKGRREIRTVWYSERRHAGTTMREYGSRLARKTVSPD
jgi:hypothetical protein